MNTSELKTLKVLTLLLGILLAIVSYFGAFLPATYARETASLAAQGTGQDLFDLFIIVPLLFVSYILMSRNSLPGLSVFSGTLLYIVYSFVIYCFGVHFNKLFLLYCAILGLSVYSFIMVISATERITREMEYSPSIPRRSTGIFFIIVTVLFYALWLKSIVPALLQGTVPGEVTDYNLPVNPVHVLDISLMLPALLITAVSLLKRKRLGFLLAPVFLVFTILLALALVAMVLILYVRNISEDLTVTIAFLVMALFSMFFIFGFYGKRGVG